MRNVSEMFVEKIKTHVLCTVILSQESCRLRDNVEKYSRVGQATDDNKAHAHSMPNNYGYKHTLTIYNNYCFPTATMFARTRLNVVPVLQETTDSEIKDLYFKHLFTQPYHKAFTTSAVGVDRMRRGLYAFHGDADAFKIISETYDEQEKCRLKDIRMFSTVQLALTVRKGSPYKEHIRQR